MRRRSAWKAWIRSTVLVFRPCRRTDNGELANGVIPDGPSEDRAFSTTTRISWRTAFCKITMREAKL